MASSPECITWMIVGLTESVTIVVLNSLTGIAFCRDRNLRKRSTYLVISLAVADMLSGGISAHDLLYNVGEMCNFWGHNRAYWYIPQVFILWFPVCSLTIMIVIFSRRPECNVLALQTSYDQKVRLLGSYHRHLVNSTPLFMCVTNDLLLYR